LEYVIEFIVNCTDKKTYAYTKDVVA